MKKIILCLGDSNTFGFNPENGKRYKADERWSGIFKKELEKTANYKVIENGQNNRSCFSSEIKELNCYQLLNEIIENNLTDIIFAVGINDLQFHYNQNKETLEKGIDKTIKKIKELNKDINILLLIPNAIKDNILNSNFSNLFNKKSIELSKELENIYQKISESNNCSILKLDNIIKTSAYDSLHFDKINHKILAEKLIEYYSNNPKTLPIS